MRLFYLSLFAASCIIVNSCKNVADVKPTNRTTFVKVYEKGGDFSARVTEVLSDGYIMGANFSTSTENTSYISKLDVHGNIVWEGVIPNSSVTSIKQVADGYLVLGNSIQLNDTALNINNRVLTKLLLTKMNLSGNIVDSVAIYDPNNPTTDFQGTGLTLDLSGNIILSGISKSAQTNSLTSSLVAACSPTTLDTLWTRTYSLIDQDFSNAKNIFVSTSGSIIWTNSIQKINLSQTLSYLSTSSIVPQGTFDNYSYYGQSLAKNRFVASEMQDGFFSYGVVGTFADSQGKNGNMFFIQVDHSGNFLDNTLIMLDGGLGIVPSDNTSLSGTPVSQSEDFGSAVSYTRDGGFLIGGSFNTTVKRGNGGLDIWLVKIDALGNVEWNKNYGGSGDDTVNSIRLMNDGSFLVSGGSSVNGLSSSYLMRIDANGGITQ